MKSCNCTLRYTDPTACNRCMNKPFNQARSYWENTEELYKTYKNWREEGEKNMSGGIESMYEESKPIDWKLLDKERKEHEQSVSQVVRDLKERQAFGLQKYGKSLTAATDEDMLQHLYEELLDASIYIRTLIEQRKHD